MKETFLDTAEQILRFKAHRELVVRKMVITMIPSLAAYDTQTFTEHFLHKSMAHLLTQLEKPAERSFGAYPRQNILPIVHLLLFQLSLQSGIPPQPSVVIRSLS